MRTFGDYISGKSVAIIGGAPSFDEAAFDADVVVRINEHAVTQGGRADVIYSALANDPQQFFKAGIAKNLRWFMADRRGRFYSEPFLHQLAVHRVQTFTYETIEHHAPGYRLSEFWLNRVMAQYKCKPFTGIVAALHALAHPVASVYLTGFTFYAKDGHVPAFRHSHLIEPNREIVADLLRWDRRLQVDAPCEEALTLPILSDLDIEPTEGAGYGR